jgi:hypothetical protein
VKALIMFWRCISIFPLVDLRGCGSGRDEEPSGAKVLRLIQIRLVNAESEKISSVCQADSRQRRIAIALIAKNPIGAHCFARTGDRRSLQFYCKDCSIPLRIEGSNRQCQMLDTTLLYLSRRFDKVPVERLKSC